MLVIDGRPGTADKGISMGLGISRKLRVHLLAHTRGLGATGSVEIGELCFILG
ncbi:MULTISPECIES: hypothetical protein [unclassified Bradyrhizobium]|uniref:hypothetical protein n=1 Tax=unclassified Bradyrhizobium TaxID=2631580 RepID=UPI002916088C|nr:MULTISPECIES: hypothetical protein [unclassified Bradyrhizobium]